MTQTARAISHDYTKGYQTRVSEVAKDTHHYSQDSKNALNCQHTEYRITDGKHTIKKMVERGFC